MGLTQFNNGVASMGIPVVGGALLTTGNVWFVHHSGSNGNSGTDTTSPFADIDYAIGRCTASNDDHIICMAGHAETISAAAAIACDVIGVTIRGVGRGTMQPSITFDTANTTDIDIDAASVTFENIHFIANFADIAAAIDVNATDFTMLGCRFTEAATNMNAKVWVQDAAAAGSSRMTIVGCHCIALDAANTHFVNLAGTGDGHIIANNHLIGDWGTMAIGGAGIVTNATVVGNLIMNAASDNDACINFAATATGICALNLAGGGAAQANGITTGDLASCENYYGVHTEDLSAILDPVAT